MTVIQNLGRLILRCRCKRCSAILSSLRDLKNGLVTNPMGSRPWLHAVAASGLKSWGWILQTDHPAFRNRLALLGGVAMINRYQESKDETRHEF